MSAGGELYIYYRLAPDAQQGLVARLQAMQRALEAAFGCQARLLRKVGDDTLLEVYRPVEAAQPLLDAMAVHLAEMRFDDHLAEGSRRHLEHFECV